MYNDDSKLDLFGLARANKMHFGVEDKSGWFPFNFQDSIVYDLRELEDLERTSITYPAVTMC